MYNLIYEAVKAIVCNVDQAAWVIYAVAPFQIMVQPAVAVFFSLWNLIFYLVYHFGFTKKENRRWWWTFILMVVQYWLICASAIYGIRKTWCALPF